MSVPTALAEGEILSQHSQGLEAVTDGVDSPVTDLVATAVLTATGGLFESQFVTIGFRALGLALLAGFVAGAAAFLFRWRTGTELPEGPALLLGLGAVAVYLNGRIALVQFLGGEGEVLTPTAVAINLGILVVSMSTAGIGWHLGDEYGTSKRLQHSLQPNLSPLVRASGRFIVLELPKEIEDIEGYDPVSGATKSELSGKTYTFSRGLTLEELTAALSTRLKTEYGIAHVDVELTVDGGVEYFAVGGRETGIGPTLPPNATATAITADPALTASAGDTVQIWNGEKRVGTAELRATSKRTATVSARPAVVDSLDPNTEYRLMTLPVDERADRLFASMLRRADETMSAITVTEGATLDGKPVGSLGLCVIAVEKPDGTTATIPQDSRPIDGGERLFVIGHPTALRRVEAAATGTEPYEPPAETETAPKPGGLRSRLAFRQQSG